MLIPLYGFVEGDTIGLLVLAHGDMTIARVIDKLRESAAIRVDTSSPHWELCARGAVLERDQTVTDARLAALDRVDLRRARTAPCSPASCFPVWSPGRNRTGLLPRRGSLRTPRPSRRTFVGTRR